MEGIRIGVLGNVDAAKTTTISVLKHDELDNGRGSARSKLFKHKHEIETGRSSCVNHTHINLKNHLVTYVDLAGHERYLKTTMFGLNACSIDYALILVGANMGVLHMTKEHFRLAHALNIPIIFVVTKIDICPENILKDTMNKINKLIKQGYKRTPKLPYLIETNETLDKCKNFPNCSELVKDTNFKNIIPIFKISNTKGTNIKLLKEFINNLPPMIDYSNKKKSDPLFTIEETFFVDGVGCVVSGVVKEGCIKIGDKLTIGPFSGIFKHIIVKSIHDNFRNNINMLNTGMSGCICIKSKGKENIKKKHIKKGMVLNNSDNLRCAYREFLADVIILHHPTTIRENYQPVVHCGSISQSATICNIKNIVSDRVLDDQKCLMTGDKSEIRFMFTNRPEYITIGSRLIFREGKAKGIGRITKVIK